MAAKCATEPRFTLTTRDIVFLLGEINKIFELGVQLGIDVSTLRRLLGKYQYDSVDMRMIEVIDFWLKNSRDCSWDVLAKAVTRIGGHDQLAKKLKQIGKGQEAGVPEDNDLEKLTTSDQQHHLSQVKPKTSMPKKEVEKFVWDLGDIPHVSSSLCIPVSNPIIHFNELCEDDYKDLQAQMSDLTKKINVQFKKLLDQVYESLIERQVDHHRVILTLTHDDLMIFDQDKKLEEAKNMFDVFKAIRPHSSYFNYELLELIIKLHGSPKDKEEFEEYIQSFSRYCEAMPCAETICGNEDTHSSKRTKLKFKINFDRHQLKPDALRCIKHNIAHHLKVKPGSLYLHKIKEGCTELEFLVPKIFFKRVFPLNDEQKYSLYTKVKVITVKSEHEDLNVDVEKDVMAFQTHREDIGREDAAKKAKDFFEDQIMNTEGRRRIVEVLSTAKADLEPQVVSRPSSNVTSKMDQILQNQALKNTSSMSFQNNTGFAFGFKLPSEGLALHSVAIENGTPKLIFDAALKTPTLTEEDVGIACQLACEGKRPEFFYYDIPPHHPYHGRQYKHYSPQWLRGTSIGELLSEADWTMKCLNIGARSDKTKERFWAWQETSKLEGLAAIFDFPDDKPPGSVMMTCDSVEVQKTDSEMVFLGEPKMKITADRNSSYTKYITDIYPSIAYYDEPLLLKMQELIKLILAVEWLKEKGVRFSRPWMTECSTLQSQKASQAIEVKTKGPREDAIKEVIGNLVKQLPETSHQEVMTVLGPLSLDVVVDKKVTNKGIEVKIVQTILPSSHTSPKVEVTTTLRASVNDYDMLYSGMDPNMPIQPQIAGVIDAIIPNVQSWSELFAETVPWPRTWKMPYDGVEIFSAGGGVSTNSIPIREPVATHSHVQVPSRGGVKEEVPVREAKRQGQYVKYSNGRLSVEARRGKREEATRVRRDMVPQQEVVSRPGSNVTSKTDQTLRNQELKQRGQKQAYGWDDIVGGQRVVYDERGQLIKQERAVRSYVEQSTTVSGQPGGIRPPPNLQPLPIGEEQQVALPAGATGLFSPDGSITSIDSGFESLLGGQLNDMLEGRSHEPAKDKDDTKSDDSNDSGKDDSEFGDDGM